MARNGTGTFVRLYDFTNDELNTLPISSLKFDNELDGMATALSDSISRDGQTTIAANIPLNSFKITGLGDATAATDALNRQSADARYYTQTQSDALFEIIGKRIGDNPQSGTSYTLALTDVGKVIRMTSASSNTITVPPNSSVAFPLRTWIQTVRYGTGSTTIVAGSGVTIRSVSGTLTLASQYSGGLLYQVATDEWWLSRTS